MESKKLDKEAAIILAIFGVLMIFTTYNIPDSYADPWLSLTPNQETRGILSITQEGTAEIMRAEKGLAAEHIVSLTISGNYTFGSEGLKIDAKSLTGTLVVDDGHPIKLNIQKVGAYKDLRTLFYRAAFVGDIGSISGKLKLTSPINFESDTAPTISGSTTCTKIGSVMYYSGTTSGDISIRFLPTPIHVVFLK